MKGLKNNICLLFAVLIGIACNRTEQLSHVPPKDLKITLPEPLPIYNRQSVDYDSFNSSRFQLITLLRSNCTDCIRHLEKLSALSKEPPYQGNVRILAFAVGEWSDYVEHFTDSVYKFNFPVFCDTDSSFFKGNYNPELIMFKTFLTDTSGNVLLRGSPHLTKTLRPVFEQKIDQLLKVAEK